MAYPACARSHPEVPLPNGLTRHYCAPVDDDWRDAVPEDVPPLFRRVDYDVLHGVDIVGRDDDGLFCVDDDEHDRSVWWVSERDPGLPRRFVNTSVGRFRDSLRAFYSTWRSLPRLSADEAGRAISELRRDLTEIEMPGVTTEPDDYWQVILGQVENRFTER